MAVTSAAPEVFSTTGLPAARRVELWEEHNAAALVALTCTTTTPFEAAEVNVCLGQLRLARVTGSAHAVERSARVIRAEPADAVAVYVALRGTASFEHDGGASTLRPGSVLVCDADRPFRRGFAEGLEELAVTVPRAVFRERAALPRAPVIVDVADPYARALAAQVGRATRPAHAVTPDERTLLDLITLVSGGDGDPSVAHRAAAKAFIEAHLSDHGLSASAVAVAVGISERHLSRVFAVDGASVPRHILARRLHLAHAVLDGGTGGSVADVAARCGFTSATYFSHAFHTHFGVRAGEVRREGELRISAIRAREPGQATSTG
jgi:AraC-like DNA-binding protein